MPLHPALAHFPIALAVFMPVVSCVILVRGSPRAWLVPLVLQLAIVGFAAAGLQTGGEEAALVQEHVPAHAIETHEDLANGFLWGSAVLFLVYVAVFAMRERPPRALRTIAVLATLGSIGLAALALRTGAAGGALVYEYDAATHRK